MYYIFSFLIFFEEVAENRRVTLLSVFSKNGLQYFFLTLQLKGRFLKSHSNYIFFIS